MFAKAMNQSSVSTARSALSGQQCGKRQQRNFLRENKQQLRRLAARNAPTALSTKSSGMGTARGIWNAGPGVLAAHERRLTAARTGCSLAEKQIQTEDINDEHFLNEALRKCAEHGAALLKRGDNALEVVVRSEDDDMQAAGLSYNGGRLRRTCSAIELGRVPAQRGVYLSGHFTLQRPLGCAAGIVPGSLDQPLYWTQEQLRQAPPVLSGKAGDKISIGSDKRSLHAVQMAIPEFIDVEHEPEPSEHAAKCAKPAQSTQQQESPQQQELILLTEPQRLALIDGAQTRRQQLIEEYNRLPIAMRTLRVRNLKIQLEHQLDMIDSDLNVLAKRQVFVKPGANLTSN